jgi:tetratricopeptide (TPR) repeat protein
MILLLLLVGIANGESRRAGPPAAIRESRFAIRVPQESSQRLRAGQEKIKVRDFDGAIPEFERCLQLQPEEYNASYGLGVCYWEKEQFRKAREQFTRVVELVGKENPGATLIDVHQKLLGCAVLLEEFDTAVAEATRLINAQPRAEYFYARALARQRQGDAKGAVDDCAEALREEPGMTKARTLRAYALLAGGDREAGLAEYAAALRAKPSDPGGYLGRACALYRLERWKEALDDLRSARRLNAGASSNFEELGYVAALTILVRTRSGEKGAAAEEAAWFREALRTVRKDPAGNHLLLLPLYLAGEVPEADLVRAAEASPARKAQARGEVHFFIGERKLLEGDKAGARQAFKSCADAGARGNVEHDLALIRRIVLGE